MHCSGNCWGKGLGFTKKTTLTHLSFNNTHFFFHFSSAALCFCGLVPSHHEKPICVLHALSLTSLVNANVKMCQAPSSVSLNCHYFSQHVLWKYKLPSSTHFLHVLCSGSFLHCILYNYSTHTCILKPSESGFRPFSRGGGIHLFPNVGKQTSSLH